MDEKTIGSEENQDEIPQVINLTNSGVEVVEAELVRLHQSGAQEITAEEVELHQSAVLDATAAEVNARESMLGMVTAKDVEMTNSLAGIVRAENVGVTGSAGVVLAGSANMGDTYVGLVAGQQVRAERIESLVLFARNVEGEVQTVVDTRGALIAGMVGGLFAGLIVLVGRMVFGRKS